MPAPRIEIELDKLVHNARKLTALYGSKGICITAVTKGFCGSPRIASALLDSGIRSFGDSYTDPRFLRVCAGLDVLSKLKVSRASRGVRHPAYLEETIC
jgi:hypothetical protein